jgi:hypothetical protein
MDSDKYFVFADTKNHFLAAVVITSDIHNYQVPWKLPVLHVP